MSIALAWPFARGLVVALALAAVALLVARRLMRARPAETGRAENLLLGASCAAGFLFLFQNVLVHDALWYYGYLRSAMVQGNLDLYDAFVLHNPHEMYLPPPETPIFHLGTSLLQAPIALLVRPIVLLLSRTGWLPGGDGYGPLEVGAATWSSMMLGLGGVALTFRLARRVAGGGAACVAQAALLYASPLAFFTFVWPGYPHASSVFLGALFLLLWAADVSQHGERGRWLLLGILGGALALIHPQDIVYLALPGLDLASSALRDRRAGVLRSESLRSAAVRVAALTGGACVGFAPQIAAWWSTSGRILPNVYAEIGDPFRFGHPALLDVLVSGYNGLLTWTPLCGVGAVGIFLLRRSQPRLFRGLLALVLLEWWAIASYGYWWGGASFGARYFLSAYPAFGIGLALVVARLGRRIGLLAAGMLTVPFIYWNLLLMAQFRLEWIPHNHPPRFGDILWRQIAPAPEALARGLMAAFRWNQVVVIENLRAAVEAQSPGRAALWAAFAGALVMIIVGWVSGLAGRPLPPAAPGRRRPGGAAGAAAVGAGFSALATLLVLLVASGHATRLVAAQVRELPIRLAPGEATLLRLTAGAVGPNDDQPTAAVVPASWRKGESGDRLTIDLVSFLHNGEARRQGETIAQLRPAGPGCVGVVFPIRAGLETAETAPDRIEIRGAMRHRVDTASPIQSWWQRDRSARHYWGHAYLASFDLPAVCVPRQIGVAPLPGPGMLEIRRLVVRADRSGR